MNNLMEFISQMIKDTGKGLKGYLKAQLILMGMIFIILAIGLRILEVPYFIWISIVVSIVDVLPVLGAGIVIVPWSVISFILGNSYLGKGLALIYII